MEWIRNIRTPYVSNWNLDIQHAITNNLSIDIGYVGNHGTKLLGKTRPQPASARTAGMGHAADSNRLQTMHNAGHVAIAAQVCQSLLESTCALYAKPTLNRHPSRSPLLVRDNVSRARTRTWDHGRTVQSNQFVLFVPELHHPDQEQLRIQLRRPASDSDGPQLPRTLVHRRVHLFSRSRRCLRPGDISQLPGSARTATAVFASSCMRTPTSTFATASRFRWTTPFPDRKGFGQLLEGWAVNSDRDRHSGLPWGLSDQSDDFSGTNVIGHRRRRASANSGTSSAIPRFHPGPRMDRYERRLAKRRGGLPFFAGGGHAAARALPMPLQRQGGGTSDRYARFARQPRLLRGRELCADSGCVRTPTATRSRISSATPASRTWTSRSPSSSQFKERLKAEVRVEIFNILQSS